MSHIFLQKGFSDWLVDWLQVCDWLTDSRNFQNILEQIDLYKYDRSYS